MTAKLVRDLIPARIAAEGLDYPNVVLDDAAFAEALDKKLAEETAEFLSAPTAHDRLVEAADVLEVLLTSIGLDGYDVFDLIAARGLKKATSGGFNRRICVTFPDEPT